MIRHVNQTKQNERFVIIKGKVKRLFLVKEYDNVVKLRKTRQPQIGGEIITVNKDDCYNTEQEARKWLLD